MRRGTPASRNLDRGQSTIAKARDAKTTSNQSIKRNGPHSAVTLRTPARARGSQAKKKPYSAGGTATYGYVPFGGNDDTAGFDSESEGVTIEDSPLAERCVLPLSFICEASEYSRVQVFHVGVSCESMDCTVTIEWYR
eukprot:4502615-Pleurochrysis_carterae.AAC.2